MNILILGLGTGIIFGIIIQKIGASDYDTILGAFRLKDLKIPKVVLLAISIGSVGIAMLNRFGVTPLYLLPFPVFGIVIGGIIFGSGMALSGYCPGSTLVAISEGKIDAIFCLLGGLTGALFYALIYPYIRFYTEELLNLGKISISSLLGINHLYASLIFVALILASLYFFDRTKDASKK